MIARTLLIPENAGRGILVWLPETFPSNISTRAMQGRIKAWTSDREKIFVELEKDYGKGRREGNLIEVPRDICSFRQTDTGD